MLRHSDVQIKLYANNQDEGNADESDGSDEIVFSKY